MNVERRYSDEKGVIYTSSKCNFFGHIDGDGFNWRRAFIESYVLMPGVFEMARIPPHYSYPRYRS